MEVIVIDGNSSDHTSDVLSEYTDVVTFTEQDDGSGIYPAMNQGIRRSSGDWLYFLNSGDVVHNDALSAIQSHLVGTEPSIVYGATVCNGNYKPTKPLPEYWQGSRFSHQAVFIHRALIEQTGYDTSFRILGDYDFLCGTYSKGIPFREVDLVVADVEPGGISFSPSVAKTREYIRAAKRYYPDKPVAQHQIKTYLNHKFLIRRRIFLAGEIFWKSYHRVRLQIPQCVRTFFKTTIEKLRA